MTTSTHAQGKLFDSPDNDSETLDNKGYKAQQETIDKSIDYVSRKAIELRPLDFLKFFPEIQSLSAEEQKQIKVLDANRTLETYLKREVDSLSLIIDTEIEKLKNTVFHIEVQTSYDETMNERILVYDVLILQKTKKKLVKSLLNNLDPDIRNQELGNQYFGSVNVKYDVINLWEQGYEEIKQQNLLGLLPFTPYLKGGGRQEIKEASELLKEQITNPQEQAQMIFMLAILAGRKYNRFSISFIIINGYEYRNTA
ncbi:MAG: hypothetical protein DRR16_03105 [Candidatus Parabeggiatoa sp. nov. 3]|nr:MAG: hypothetical protein DRR00_05205 [Gammaproteobacteria bacterium]RKZ63990.1 MAG: hypothetical protein DRQ99_16145 [Gammaproteobacteria bacterium]RKZ89189.1 MAG: hypothetical protein DRR16_03105 [Gammaproteobacteria bacterium]